MALCAQGTYVAPWEAEIDPHLDATQRMAVRLVTEHRQNVLVTGPAGVGKSRVLAAVIRTALKQGSRVAVTAPTGLAALNLVEMVEAASSAPEGASSGARLRKKSLVPGGAGAPEIEAQTLHRFASLVVGEWKAESAIERIKARPYQWRMWQNLDYWIIDEVSMVSPAMFELLDRIARGVRGRPHAPFGGIVMLFSGDFYQLPPVVTPDDAEQMELNGDRDFCFECPGWAETVNFELELSRIYRQGGDEDFLVVLQELRNGALSQNSLDLLRSRLASSLIERLRLFYYECLERKHPKQSAVGGGNAGEDCDGGSCAPGFCVSGGTVCDVDGGSRDANSDCAPKLLNVTFSATSKSDGCEKSLLESGSVTSLEKRPKFELVLDNGALIHKPESFDCADGDKTNKHSGADEEKRKKNRFLEEQLTIVEKRKVGMQMRKTNFFIHAPVEEVGKPAHSRDDDNNDNNNNDENEGDDKDESSSGIEPLLKEDSIDIWGNGSSLRTHRKRFGTRSVLLGGSERDDESGGGGGGGGDGGGGGGGGGSGDESDCDDCSVKRLRGECDGHERKIRHGLPSPGQPLAFSVDEFWEDCPDDGDPDSLRERILHLGERVPDDLLPLACEVKPTKLMTRNDRVDAENRMRMAELPEDPFTFNAAVACTGAKSSGQEFALMSMMRRSVRAPEQLTLKVGAQVMLLANLVPGLVNGSRGVVVAFEREDPSARPEIEVRGTGAFQKRKARFSEPTPAEETQVSRARLWPRVRFLNGQEMVMLPVAWRRSSKRDGWSASYVQVPLKPAWAISIHKSQGMTISLLSVDLEGEFASGQAYVALSRATSLKTLVIEGMCIDNGNSRHPNEKVVAFYKELRKRQKTWISKALLSA